MVGGSTVVVAAGAAALRASRDRCGAFLLHFLEVLLELCVFGPRRSCAAGDLIVLRNRLPVRFVRF